MMFIEILIKKKKKDMLKKINMLSIQEKLSKLDLSKTQMDFDATSLYPSAMWDENSVFRKMELDLLLSQI